MVRMVFLALVMAVVEVAWALFAAKTEINLAIFYGVLVVASLVFFLPKLGDGSTSANR